MRTRRSIYKSPGVAPKPAEKEELEKDKVTQNKEVDENEEAIFFISTEPSNDQLVQDASGESDKEDEGIERETQANSDSESIEQKEDSEQENISKSDSDTEIKAKRSNKRKKLLRKKDLEERKYPKYCAESER